MTKAILWFRNDLRLHDNEALLEAMRNAEEVYPVYVFSLNDERVGPHRIQFLTSAVRHLRKEMQHAGSDLIIREGNPVDVIYQLAVETKASVVFCNRERTHEEVVVQDQVEQKLWTIGRELRYTRGKMLYYTADLPFPVTHCPDSFPVFRKEVETIIQVREPLKTPEFIPPFSTAVVPGEIPLRWLKTIDKKHQPSYPPGEAGGLQLVNQFQPAGSAGSNLLEDADARFSPYIAHGCLSPKLIYIQSKGWDVEGERIRQNLIHRDYLRLMGKKYGNKIFHYSGVRGIHLARTKNESEFQKWINGKMDIPVLDAAINQLKSTGWIPEILRKFLAVYFLKNIREDWRRGAAFYEYWLTDYDPCTTWVNWQNLAGIGPDPREERLFHFKELSQRLDPDGAYINRWLSPQYLHPESQSLG